MATIREALRHREWEEEIAECKSSGITIQFPYVRI